MKKAGNSDGVQLVPGVALRSFVTEVFQRCGLVEAQAAQCADVLCTADEWGIESHGVARLAAYESCLRDGKVNPRPVLAVTKDSPSVAVIDGDNGPGFLAAIKAAELARAKARETGSSWVSVTNSNHFGIAGYYAAKDIGRKLVGIAMTNTPPLVSHPNAPGRLLGTNPIAFAFPAGESAPIIMDFSTSAISYGAVENALRKGKGLPDGCALDKLGAATTSVTEFLDGGSLLPLGGQAETGGHKGFCLAALVDILCGPLSGSAWGPFVPPFLISTQKPVGFVGQGVGHLFGAINIEAFRDIGDYEISIARWIETVSAKTTEKAQVVTVPGALESLNAQHSLVRGISIRSCVFEELMFLGHRLGIKPIDASKYI